ncbi:MAG: metal ABC transporter solute-binding protein, Zn/Mn family, partial [Saezia sp.]
QGKTIVVSDGIHPHKTSSNGSHEHEGHEHGEYDPHAWQNVMNIIIYVQNITHALETADPQHATYYQARSQSYIKQLEVLDADIIKAIEQIPPERRVLVSMHDSFAYFGQRYALKTISVLSASHEAQPSASVMAKLIQLIKQEHIPALFLDNTSNPKLLEQIARETGAVLGGKLYADALSQKGSTPDSYIKMMRTNLSVICNALYLKY